MTQLTTLATGIINFINNIAVPLVFAVAFICFIYGVFRYLIAGAASPEKRKTGGQIILYSVIGFAVMMSVWGIVNLLVGTFGFTNTNRPCLPTFNATNNCAGTTGTGSTATTPTPAAGNAAPSPSATVDCVLPTGSEVPSTAAECEAAGGSVYK